MTIFSTRKSHISSYDQQFVSCSALFFLSSSLITFHHQQEVSDHAFLLCKAAPLPLISLINRLSVTRLAFYQTLSSLCILWPIASEWHCPLSSKTCPPLISSYNQQLVSDSAYLCHCPGHHISPHNQQAVSDFDTLESGQQSHPISSHHQQNVSDSSNISA